MAFLTAGKCSSNHLKMKIKLLFLLFSFGLLNSSLAQSLQLKGAFPVEEPVAVSADAQGHIYLSVKEGEIKKYNFRGLLLYTYSPPSAGSFNVLDGSSSLQIKAFSENSQTIVYLDRFLNQTAGFQLPSDRFRYVTALSWSAGNTLWLADAGERELVRWRTETQEVMQTLNLNQFISEDNFEVSLIKEHQHKLYLFSTNRLYVFDQLGNYETQVPLASWKGVTFAENEVIILGADTLTFLDLYSFQERKIVVPAEKDYGHLSFSKGEIFLFSPQEAHIYRLVP